MYKYAIFVLALASLLSCKKESGQEVSVSVSFDNFTGKSDVNRSYNINTARLYLSNFQLVDNSGNAILVKDLILANSTNSTNTFTFKMPSGNYSKFRFHFGLDHATNHNTDPATFDASHPLSLAQDMYWGMLRYRFIVVEGQVDSSAAKDQVPANPFSMHLGTDTLYREINKDIPSAMTAIAIHIDLKSLMVLDQPAFDITNFSNHSSDSEIPKAIQITNNFVNSITVSFPN